MEKEVVRQERERIREEVGNGRGGGKSGARRKETTEGKVFWAFYCLD